MSEAKASPRPLSEIQSEYQQLCLRAGDLQYKRDAMLRDLNVINGRLRDVNLEAASLQRTEEEAKKTTEVAPQ